MRHAEPLQMAQAPNAKDFGGSVNALAQSVGVI